MVVSARPVSSSTISFGLVSIPIKLYTATSAQAVSFNQLHDKCAGRLRQRLHCPSCDEYVERSAIVKGFEIARNQYVQFSGAELNGLEAERFQTLDLVEFVPESTVDFIYIDRSQYLGPDKGGHKAFILLSKAMRRMERIAVGRYWSRGKVQLVLLRPYKKGMVLHHVYYANEVRSYEDVDLGDDVRISEAEDGLADQLINQLSTERFEPSRYRDEYADRVKAAAEQKVAGQEVTLAPEQPAAQLIDLFDALKLSLDATAAREATGTDGPGPANDAPAPAAKARGRRSGPREPKKA
jgi:DNA end-binding protein Ku